MSSQSAARNFPCCQRYVLHVSQMMLETSRIERWTGSARVRMYSQDAERRADGANEQAEKQNRLAR